MAEEKDCPQKPAEMLLQTIPGEPESPQLAQARRGRQAGLKAASKPVDASIMSVSGLSSVAGSWRPIAAGVKAQLDAAVLSDVLESAGLLDSSLAQTLDSVEVEGRSLTEAGVTAFKSDLVGSLLDVLG